MDEPIIMNRHYNKIGILCSRFILLFTLGYITISCGNVGSTWSSNPTTTSYAYIADFGNAYTMCTIDKATNLLSSCNTSQTTPDQLSGSFGIAISNNIAYITNETGKGSYTQCNINTITGALYNCYTVAPGGSGVLLDPASIMINQRYAYIINEVAIGSYTLCTVNSTNNGALSNCNKFIPDLPDTLSYPSGIVINNNFAYITNANQIGSYTICRVNPVTGVLDNCSQTTPSAPGALSYPGAIIIYAGYAYITNEVASGSYTKCSINSNNGSLFNCNTIVPSGAGALSYPAGITINNGIAYITNGNQNGSYTMCSVDSSTGLLSACNTTTPNIPGGLTYPDTIITLTLPTTL